MRLASSTRNVASCGEGTSRPGSSASLRRLPTRLALSIGKLLLSGGLVGYLVYRHGLNPEQLEKIDPTLGFVTLAIFVLQIALATVRWRALLTHITGAGASYRHVIVIYYVSVFFTQVLPSVGGDLTRVLYARTLGSTSGPIIISVLLDRGVAIAGLLFFALPSLWFLAQFDPAHTVLRSVAIVAGSGLAAASGGCLLARTMRHSRIWTGLPQWTRTLIASGDWSLTSRTGLCYLIPLSAFIHLLSVAAIFLVAHAVQVPLTLSMVLAIGPVFVLAQVLPISIGGWGVREAAAITLFPMTGIDATSALLVSIMFGILIFLATLPGVLFWLTLKD